MDEPREQHVRFVGMRYLKAVCIWIAIAVATVILGAIAINLYANAVVKNRPDLHQMPKAT